MTISDARMLVARLQLRVPGARSLLFVSADARSSTLGVAREVAESLAATGAVVGFADAVDGAAQEGEPTAARSGQIRALPLLEGELLDSARLRRAVSPVDGYTVVRGGNVLAHATTLLLAGTCDAVIVVVRERRSPRAALARCREEVESAGGRLAGAVLER